MTELKIDELVFITIDKLRTLDEQRYANHDGKQHFIPATHELVSHATGGNNIRYSTQGIEVPNADVGVLVYLRGGKLLGRGPRTRVLIYGEHLYFLLTWNDVIGHSIPGGRELCRSENGQKVKFLKQATQEQYELVMEACIKSGKSI
jgi:hypothetical protein